MSKVIDFIPKGKAFNTFILKEREKCICYLINSMGLSRNEAEDVYQESTLALWENIKGGKIEQRSASLATYLLQICRYQATHALRKQKSIYFKEDLSQIKLEIDNDDDDYDNDCLNNVLDLADEEPDEMTNILNHVEGLIKELPEPCNTLLWGRFWEKLSHQELAGILGYPSANGSKTQTSRCLSKVRKRIEQLMH